MAWPATTRDNGSTMHKKVENKEKRALPLAAVVVAPEAKKKSKEEGFPVVVAAVGHDRR